MAEVAETSLPLSTRHSSYPEKTDRIDKEWDKGELKGW